MEQGGTLLHDLILRSDVNFSRFPRVQPLRILTLISKDQDIDAPRIPFRDRATLYHSFRPRLLGVHNHDAYYNCLS